MKIIAEHLQVIPAYSIVENGMATRMPHKIIGARAFRGHAHSDFGKKTILAIEEFD